MRPPPVSHNRTAVLLQTKKSQVNPIPTEQVLINDIGNQTNTTGDVRYGQNVSNGEEPAAMHTRELVQDREMQIEIWPNPTNGRFKVRATSESNEKVLGIEIYTANGQRLDFPFSHLNQDGIERDFDMSNEGAGMYIVVITTTTGIQRQRVLITH
mgnify:CR=1 FL=1